MTYYPIHKINEFDFEPDEYWTERQVHIYNSMLFSSLDELLPVLADQEQLSSSTFRRDFWEIYYCPDLRPTDMSSEDFLSVIDTVIAMAIDQAHEAAHVATTNYAKDNEEEWHRDYHSEIWSDDPEQCNVCKWRREEDTKKKKT